MNIMARIFACACCARVGNTPMANASTMANSFLWPMANNLMLDNIVANVMAIVDTRIDGKSPRSVGKHYRA